MTFLSVLDEHKKILEKTDQELEIRDQGEGVDRFPNQWSVLFDTAFVAAPGLLHAVVLKRKPRRPNVLSADDWTRNRNIARDRVKVENFYGRQKKLWKCVREKGPIHDPRKIGMLFEFTVLLTNFHLIRHPLNAADGEFYNHWLRRVIREGKRKRDKDRENWKDQRDAKRRRQNEGQ